MKSVHIIRQDEAAVSPVIATILMVAITVVLAAVLYVMVSGLITGPGSTPRAMGVQLVRSGDGSNWVMTIITTPSGLTPTNTRLSIFKADGSTNMTATAMSSLSLATRGCVFQDASTPANNAVDAGDKVLCRTGWYAPGGKAEISDAAGILFAGPIAGPGSSGPGSIPRSLVATVARSPSPPYKYTLTIVSAFPGLTPTNTKVSASNPQGVQILSPTPLADFNKYPLSAICVFTDAGTTGIVDAGDKVVCGTTSFPLGGKVEISDAIGILWSGTLPPPP